MTFERLNINASDGVADMSKNEAEIVRKHNDPIHDNYTALRAEEIWQQAGAFSVRIQGMNRQHHISLRDEFDEHDGTDSRYIVLLDDTYPVATCRFYELDSRRVLLGRVVVLPEYRGKGLGRQAIEEAERWIRELGFHEVRIDSRVEAVGFYEKLGYRRVDNKVIKSWSFDCVRMSKSL